MARDASDAAETRVLPRALAGSTVMQIVHSLRAETDARATLDVARALVLAGARAIVAGESGPLVAELKSFGGEWVPFASATLNPIKLRRNAEALGAFLAAQRVDIVHAKTVGAAWSAQAAASHNAVRLAVDLPELPRMRM